MTFPSQYLLIKQAAGSPCLVLVVRGGAESVLFSGKRWLAKRQADHLAATLKLPLYNQKKSRRRGHPGTLVLCSQP